MIALLIAGALAAGYLLGRTRPARRISDWAERLLWRRPAVTRRHWQWWAAQPVYACQIAVLLATQPRHTVHAWRTRNDPPPRSPAVKLVSPWPPEDPR